jgi:two-component system, cell cycle sensor histidine kinase and response regulator CckA
MNMNATAPLRWPENSDKLSAETFFHAVFGNAPMGAARCDRRGLILETNPVLKQALAHSVDMQPVRLRDLVPAEEREQVETSVHQLAQGGRASLRLQARGTTRNCFFSEWTVWRTSEDEDSLLLVEDLAESQVESAQLQRHRWEALGRLAGGVFHDFNNLLTGVTLYSDLLLAGLQGNRLWRYADEIRSAVLQADGLVRQLLVLAQQRASQCHVVSLNQVAAGMQSLLTRLIGENVTLKFHLASDLGLVKIDPAQAQQILLNLALNARDALPEGGEITIETSNCRFQTIDEASDEPGPGHVFPCVMLAVKDNGRGMDKATRQRLFEPFFSTKSPEQGSGLGLATVHSIVSRASGLIHVESAPRQGTRMMILLPRANDSAAEAGQAHNQDSEVLPKTKNQPTAEELIL